MMKDPTFRSRATVSGVLILAWFVLIGATNEHDTKQPENGFFIRIATDDFTELFLYELTPGKYVAKYGLLSIPCEPVKNTLDEEYTIARPSGIEGATLEAEYKEFRRLCNLRDYQKAGKIIDSKNALHWLSIDPKFGYRRGICYLGQNRMRDGIDSLMHYWRSNKNDEKTREFLINVLKGRQVCLPLI
ncbi:MAG: hypothetical protein IPK73_04465 [Candidatus Obscuribacter sp.]|nr:hypothetical protein [Candidatus Obscuribacter sp.]MBK9280951.1 hypothetical protein [Candidatus Obscuribacter sp.]